ncbi:hypothetical protein DFJ77DRAFT_465293 [Powellomyces hirtus]|nr:hypothetical protein DFJ77DRAFT_465293 [Powellomyces hirtus]
MGLSRRYLAQGLLLFSAAALISANPIPHPAVEPAISATCQCDDQSVPYCLSDDSSFCICAHGLRAICMSEILEHTKNGHVPMDPNTPRFWWTLGGTIVLVLIGGIFAGLTIGIMSLDTTNLEILRNSGTEQERKHANKIWPIRKHGHWVLTTLLLGNVVINETLPILFDSLVGGGVAAIIISTGLVVLFGEIIPNAICARNGLAVGATFAPIVQVCMWIMAPLAWPIAKILDCILGHDEGTVYARAQLKTLIRIHEEGQGGLGQSGDLIHDEVGIISAVLDLKDKTVMQIMTPIDDVFMMEVSQVIDVDIIRQLITRGHSRIPIYQHHRTNIVAILLAKRLIGYNVEKARRVSDVPLTYLPMIDSETNLFDMLNFFQEGRSHMAAVAGRTDGSRAGNDDEGKAEREILGIITLEDVIEELIGEEIIDETDEYVDVHTKIPVKRAPITKKLAKLLVTNITRGRPGGSTPGRPASRRSSYGSMKDDSNNSNSNSNSNSSNINTRTSRRSRPPGKLPVAPMIGETFEPSESSLDITTPTSVTRAPVLPSQHGKPPTTPGEDHPRPQHPNLSATLQTTSPSHNKDNLQDSTDYFSMPIDETQTRDERLQEAGWVVSPLNPDDRHSRKVLSRKKTRVGAAAVFGPGGGLPATTVSAPGSLHGDEGDETAEPPETAEAERAPLLKKS